MVSGTACRLNPRLNIEIDPGDMSEAIPMSTNEEIWLADKVNIRGTVVNNITLILCQDIRKVKRGIRPSDAMNGTWMAMWRKAPTATPTARPGIPKAG